MIDHPDPAPAQSAKLPAQFDLSLLPTCEFQFVVVSDTHYMLDPGDQPVEFESRRVQAARVAYALDRLAGLDVPLVVHLGDLIQEHPGTARFAQALSEVHGLLARTGLRFEHVAGNHDLGDKPDPTMPAPWTTGESLAGYHELFGRSWRSFDAGGIHFVVLNSSIMNGPLPEDAEQRRWVEQDLRAHVGQRIFLFSHYPPYLFDEHEPALGIYDNLDEPARGWLLALVRQHRVELLFTGHCHFAWFDRIGPTRFYVAASTTFTRPGFSDLFSSCPPDDRGRNDVAKLGFYLARVQSDGTRVHFIRTWGGTTLPGHAEPRSALITRHPRDLPDSPLGIVVHHPLAPVSEVSFAWPSSARQRLRNDYPFLACLDLGVRHLRVPASDLHDPVQRQRLEFLRDEGVRITADWLWSESLDLPTAITQAREQIAGAVVHVLGSPDPPIECLQQIKRAADIGVPITLSTIIPRRSVVGKQHLRTRIGYQVAELGRLNLRLADAGIQRARVVVRVGSDESPWDIAQNVRDLPHLDRIVAIDLAVELPSGDEARHVARAAEAMLAATILDSCRVWLEPLVDLDRTMDLHDGLLDRLNNPRPAFEAVRCLNSILFARAGRWQPVARRTTSASQVREVTGVLGTAWLILPDKSEALDEVLDLPAAGYANSSPHSARLYRLTAATSETVSLGERIKTDGGPWLLVAENAAEASRVPRLRAT